MMIVIEQTIDENTGLDCWLIIDSEPYTVLDRAFDAADARDIADYYSDIRGDAYEVDEAIEWHDFDPDC